MVNYGIRAIKIDEKKGISATEAIKQAIEHPDKDFSRGLTVASAKLQEVLDDKKMPSPERAHAAHSHTVDMIKNLWGTPTGEKIVEFKRGIFGLVDLLLADDSVSDYLLKLTTYEYNTYIHSANVGLLGILLSKALFKNENRHDMYALGAGFFLHDIGKINIDEAIINKEDALTKEEMAIMRRHPGMGFRILNEAKQMGEESRLIVMEHHERQNGTGYPRRMRGDEIHIYGKICSVADVFDALVSKRPFRAPMKPFDALTVMKEEMLDHFSKDVFEKFVLLFK